MLMERRNGMLGDNIKTIRMRKGYSQQTLADQLHVVRQTISKWEKGISVPDAQLLQDLADVLEVSVDELLGANIAHETSEMNDVAKQLAILNEQLALQSQRRKKIIKALCIGLLLVFIVSWIMFLVAHIAYRTMIQSSRVLEKKQIVCTLNEDSYTYGVTYDENMQIIYAGGDAWISNHVQTEIYEDANVLLAQIEDYFSLRGGSCEINIVEVDK